MQSHNNKLANIKAELIAGNVLVKIIESSPADQDTNWLFLLNQLKNPQSNRPVIAIKSNQKRHTIWDAKERKWVFRNTTQVRGRKKNTPYVKKTPMTLPPQNGQMKYFGGKNTNYAGIGFVIEEKGKELVQVKEKYIFPTNIVSKTKPWLFDEDKKNHTLASPRLTSTTLQKLREHNDKAQAEQTILTWNEVIASPSRPAVNFLFTPHDTWAARLNLLAKRKLVAKELGETLPLVIMGETTPVKEYSLTEQLQDVIKLFSSENRNKINSSYQGKIDLVQLVSLYNEERQEADAAGKIALDDYIGELLLNLLKNGRPEQFSAVLNAINTPLTSKNLDACLHWIVESKQPKLAALLLAKGADINYIPDDGPGKYLSTLAFAIYSDQRETFSAMMALAPEKFHDKTLNQALLWSGYEKSESSSAYFLSTLLNAKIPVNTNLHYWEKNGYLALHSAADKQHLSVIKLICQLGGNPGQSPGKNLTPTKTPLNIALSHKNYKAVQIMLQHGGHLLTAKQRGDCLLAVLRAQQYDLAKWILNSSTDLDIPAYGSDFAAIIANIAQDKTMPEVAKQTLALHFINKSFNETTTQEGMMHLVGLLMTCSPTAKAFLFQPTKGGTNLFQKWNNENVCSFWSSIMKLAKNRMLDILNQSDQVVANEETKDFLGNRRTSFGIVFTTTSMKILNEQDRKKQAQLIMHEKNKVIDNLSTHYGLRR